MILSFLSIYTILTLFSGFLMRHEKNILGCGLTGFYPKKNKKVDLTKLYPLWVFSEERGTHSCGIAYGSERTVGTHLKSKARDFLLEVQADLQEADLTNLPIICHTRHATNGAHNSSNAHPFKWYRTTEDNYFIFAHNGVIKDLYNYKKNLGMSRHAEKLMEIDSQVLGLAMYDAFTDILTEEEILTTYEGNAAFLCYDKNNIFKAWKGANNGVEERPLYYIETKEGWYFSSMHIALLILFGVEPTLVPNNTLLTFNNHKLVSSTVYNRAIKSVVYPVSDYSASNTFKKLVATAEPEETFYTTGNKLVNNILKMSLKNILKGNKQLASKNSKDIVDTKCIIKLEQFGVDKAKYCIEEGDDLVPINGTKVVDFQITDDATTPFISSGNSAGTIFSFQEGVLVKPGKNYKMLNSWFNDLLKREFSFESIFNVMYHVASETVVDFIPLYKNNDLAMIIFKDSDSISYITNNDTIGIQLPSVLGINHTVRVHSKKLYLD